LIDLANKQVS